MEYLSASTLKKKDMIKKRIVGFCLIYHNDPQLLTRVDYHLGRRERERARARESERSFPWEYAHITINPAPKIITMLLFLFLKEHCHLFHNVVLQKITGIFAEKDFQKKLLFFTDMKTLYI